MSVIDTLRSLFHRGFIDPSSSDFSIEKLPDGRHRVDVSPQGFGSLAAQALEGGSGAATLLGGGSGGGGGGTGVGGETPNLFCDSTGNSLSKCGFEPFFVSTGNYSSIIGAFCGVTTVPVSQAQRWLGVNCTTCASDPGCTSVSDTFPSGATITLLADGTCGASSTGCVSGTMACMCAPALDDACYEFHLINEYTTEMLITNTLANIPAYPGTFAGSCSASRTLAGNEFSYSVSRFIPKFTFSAQPVARTLHYNEHLIPDVGSPSNAARTIAIGPGVTTVTGAQVLEPSANGYISITDEIITTP